MTGVPITPPEALTLVVLGLCWPPSVRGSTPTSRRPPRTWSTPLDRLEPNQERHEEYQFYVDQYCASYSQMQDLTHIVVDHESAK